MRKCLIPIFVFLLILLPSCVERRMLIRSEPPGAAIFIDSKEAGKTPLTRPFAHYGGRQIELMKPGYKRVNVVEDISPPWYEIFPIDFISEVLWPWTVVDEHTLAYRLEKNPPLETQKEFSLKLIEEAEQLKKELE